MQLFTEVKNSLHGSNTSQNCKMDIQDASSGAASTVKKTSKRAQKEKTMKLILQRPQNGFAIIFMILHF